MTLGQAQGIKSANPNIWFISWDKVNLQELLWNPLITIIQYPCFWQPDNSAIKSPSRGSNKNWPICLDCNYLQILLHPRQDQGSEQEGFLTISFIGNNSMVELWALVTEDAGVSLLHLSHPERPKNKMYLRISISTLRLQSWILLQKENHKRATYQ